MKQFKEIGEKKITLQEVKFWRRNLQTITQKPLAYVIFATICLRVLIF